MSGGRWRAAALGALVSGVLASPAPAADPQLRLTDRPSQLRAGEQARVAAAVDDLAACRLRLRVGTRPAGSALADADGASQLVWRWRVARDSGSARWRGIVECWSEGASPPTGPVDQRRAFSATIAGRPRRPPRLVDGRRLLVEIKPDRPAASPRTTLENLASIAQIIGLAGLVFVWLTLRAGRRQMRSERTSRIMERYLALEFIKLNANVVGFLDAPDEEVCLDKIKRWETAKADEDLVEDLDDLEAVTRSELAHAIYFYEEIATLFNRNEIDRATVMRTFGDTVAQGLEASWWWIQYERDGLRPAADARAERGGETGYYVEWEQAVLTMVRINPNLGRARLNRPGRDDRVRALCLPAKRGSRDDDEWAQCARLSRTIGEILGPVTTREDRLAQLETALAACDPDGRHRAEASAPERTILIMPWRDELLGRRGWRRASRRARISLAAWVHVHAPWTGLGEWAGGRIDPIAAKDPRVARYKRYQRLAILLDLARRQLGTDGTIDRVRAAAK